MSREFEFVTSMDTISADLFCQMPHCPQTHYIPILRTRKELLQGLKEGKEDPGNEQLYEIRIKRNKSGSAVDFEFYFTVNPIYFYYRALIIKIIKSFTTLGTKSSEELKLNAWDKYQNIKDNTSQKIQSALLQTTNTMEGSVLNPKLILPFTQNNDLKSPTYVL